MVSDEEVCKRKLFQLQSSVIVFIESELEDETNEQKDKTFDGT